jgi:GNAT superfamily N-acetyltransferase
MTAVEIRPLELDDLDQALGLSTTAGWNQQLDDWRLFLRIAPAGALAAVADARVVGTAIGVDYGGFAWIAMMLVDPAYRGRGVGGRLLEAAIASVPANIPVRLDATPRGRHLYDRYGFEVETTLRRFVVDRAFARHADTDAVRPMTNADLPLAIDCDREIFGGTRASVLDWAFHSAPGYAHVARTGDGAIQYCFGRRGRLFDQIGPVVAGDTAVAHALLHAACAAASGRPIAVDAFDLSAAASAEADHRTSFAAGLREQGFVVQRQFFRMRLTRGGSGGAKAPLVSEYAIFGPEFG